MYAQPQPVYAQPIQQPVYTSDRRFGMGSMALGVGGGLLGGMLLENALEDHHDNWGPGPGGPMGFDDGWGGGGGFDGGFF